MAGAAADLVVQILGQEGGCLATPCLERDLTHIRHRQGVLRQLRQVVKVQGLPLLPVCFSLSALKLDICALQGLGFYVMLCYYGK